MKTKSHALLNIFLLLLTSCIYESKIKIQEDNECGVDQKECDLCSDFDEKSPRFIIAIIGDGVKDDKPSMDRKYSVNRAQGEAMWNGVQLAYRHSLFVNEVKNVITIRSFDDGGSPECAKRIARCIYKNPCVLAVIGHATSGTTLEAVKYYDKARIPLIMPIATSPNVFLRDPKIPSAGRYVNIFRLPASDDEVQSYVIGLVALEKLKARRVVLIGDVSIDAPAYSEPIFEKLDKEVLGKAKFYSEKISRDKAVYIASNIKQAQPDLVIFAGYWSNFQFILGPLAELYAGSKQLPKIILSDGCLSKDITPYGFDVYVTFPAPDVNDAGLQETQDIKALKSFIKQQGYQSYEVFGYDALHVLSQAILNSKKDGISRESLIKSLNTRQQYSGAVFSYKFEHGENIKSNYYVYDAKGKKFEVIPAEDILNFKLKKTSGQ